MGDYRKIQTHQFLTNASNHFDDALDELRRKSPDYSRDGMALGDIFTIAEDAGLRPSFVAYVFAAKHWTAIRTYVKNTHLTSESIDSRLIDLANYTAILRDVVAIERNALALAFDKELGDLADNKPHEGMLDGVQGAEESYPEGHHAFVGSGTMCEKCGTVSYAKRHLTSERLDAMERARGRSQEVRSD